MESEDGYLLVEPLAEAAPELRDEPADVDPALLAALPRSAAVTWEELLEGLERARVLVLQITGVQWATLFAFCASVVINLVVVGGFIGGMLWGPWVWAKVTGKPTGQYSFWGVEASEGGSGNGGFVITGTDGLGGSVDVIGTGAIREFAPPKSDLPKPVDGAALDRKAKEGRAVAMLSGGPTEPLIGLSRGHDPLGEVSPAVARHTVPGLTAPKPPAAGGGNFTGPTLASAAPVNGNTSALEGAGGTHGTGKVDRGGIRGGTGEDDDEPTIDLLKPNVGKGEGKGRGSGSGDAIDRGASGANLPEPKLLSPVDPMRQMSPELQAKMYTRKVALEVMVEANGRAGKITILQSSGVPEIDAICQATMAKAKWQPAYEAGRAVARSYTYIFTGPGAD